MTRAFDIGAAMAAGVGGREAAWRFIRGFAADWAAEPLGDDDGCDEVEFDAAEARLGVRLPRALREAYRLLGRRADLTSNQDELLTPSQWYLDDGKEVLVFREENQGVACWGVPLDRLGEDDPPVGYRLDMADKRLERWEPWMGRLSTAVVEIVLSETLLASHELCDFLADLDEHGVETLERHCTRLPFPAYAAAPAEGRGVRWFLGDDVLLREDCGDVLLARGRTPQALDRLRGLLPGDWLNDY